MTNSSVDREQAKTVHSHVTEKQKVKENTNQAFHNHTVGGKKGGADNATQTEAGEGGLVATVKNNSIYIPTNYYDNNDKYTQTNKPNDTIDSKYFVNLDLNNKDTDAFSGYGSGSGRYLNRYLFIPLKVGSDKVDIKDRCNILEGNIQGIHDSVDKYSLHGKDNNDFGAIVALHSHIYSAALQCDSLAKEEGRNTIISQKIKKDFEASQEKLSIIKAYNTGSNPKNLTPEDIERIKDEIHSSLKAASLALDGEKDNVHEVLAKRTRYRVRAFVIFSLLLTSLVLLASIVGMVLGFQNKVNSAENSHNKNEDSLKHPLNKEELSQASGLMHGVHNQLESTHEISGYNQDFTVDGNDSRFINNSHQSMSYNTGTATNPIWTPIHDINDGQQLAQMHLDITNNPNNFQNQYGEIGSAAVSDLTASNSLYSGDFNKIGYGYEQSLLPQHNEIMATDPSDGIIKDFDKLTVAEQMKINNEIKVGNFSNVYATDGKTHLTQADLSNDQYSKYYQNITKNDTAIYNRVVDDINKAGPLMNTNGINFNKNAYISQLNTNPINASIAADGIGNVLDDTIVAAKNNNILVQPNSSSFNISDSVNNHNVNAYLSPNIVDNNTAVNTDANNLANARNDLNNVNNYAVPAVGAVGGAFAIGAIGGALIVAGSTASKNSDAAFNQQMKLKKNLHILSDPCSKTYRSTGFDKIEENDFSNSHFMQSFDGDKYRYPGNVSPVNFVSPQQINQVAPYYNPVTGENFYVNKNEDGKLYTSGNPDPAYYHNNPRNFSSRRKYRKTANNDVVGTIIKQ